MRVIPKINPAYLKYRPDIDGLRALAVLGVIGFHFFPDRIIGGFIGVDIFFVISGYLISTIIFKAIESESFSFLDFYSRRIRRIFPALLVVLMTFVALGWFVLLPDEYRYLGKHITGAATFTSNFILWSESGYFDKSADEKILLHLWSLSIEEQFYLVWPLILWLTWRYKIHPLVLIIAAAGISFYLNIKEVGQEPVAAFFSPQTRVWELLAGAALAYGSISSSKFRWLERNFLLNDVCSWLGIAFIGLSFFLIDKNSLFPGYWALLPVLGTILLIYSKDSWFNRNILSQRVLVLVGLISFPLYLWHWPLLVLVKIIETGPLSIGLRFGLIGTSLVLASLTYFFIEKPIRERKISMSQVIQLGLATLFVGIIGFVIYLQNGFYYRSAGHTTAQQEKTLLWPDQWNAQKTCIEKYPFYGRYCLESDPAIPPTVALIGDSHANHLFHGISRYYTKIGDNVLNLGGWLPFWNVENGSMNEYALREVRRKTMETILEEVSTSKSIHTIILAFRENAVPNPYRPYAPYINYWRLITHPNLVREDEMLYQAMYETLERLSKTGKKIILIEDIPGLDFNPKECIDTRPFRLHLNGMRFCGIEKEKFEKYAEVYHSIIRRLAIDFSNIHVVYPSKYLCDDKNCYAMKGEQILYRDDNHLSYAGSLYIGEQFGKEVSSLRRK